MPALRPDYDHDPDRWASHDPSWLIAGDVHRLVIDRMRAVGLRRVLDVGCGDGPLRAELPRDWGWTGIDSSTTQLHRLAKVGRRRAVLGDSSTLPFVDGTFDTVAALWVLYHLDAPLVAVGEARRVLRSGGEFFACTTSRRNDPELTSGYPPTPFDAEEAPGLVASIFGSSCTEVFTWDAPLVRLADRAALARYLRSHHLPEPPSSELQRPSR